MHALVSRTGQPSPTTADVGVPVPGPGEVLVEVVAAAVNPVDAFVASGSGHEVFGLPEEVGLGWDVAGRVAALGPGVDGFEVGEAVAGLHDDLASPVRAHAAFTVLPAAALARVPDGLDLTEAASIPLNALTAAQALDLLGPAGGRSLLVTGAAGAVGGHAVALAAASGWRVAGLARPADAVFVRRAGGEVVNEPEPASYDAVLDTAVLDAVAMAAVRDGGEHVSVLPPAPPASERGIRVQAVQVQADGQRLGELLARSAAGELEVRVAGTAPLAEASAVYEKVAGGGQRGRWLLLP
ncbi:alcohol dehydrogenase catalytic domain-containing protein [Nocardioides gansuensis]|nr:zinc-binding dehydrogenase [Nocardioides gansuensis]